jgi:hypothetical protein
MAPRFVRQRNLTFGQQMLRMGALWPGFKCAMKPSMVIWTGRVQPTEMSCTYLVQVAYVLGFRPKLSVIDPPLRRRNGTEKIPHLFPGDFLCLFQPRYGEWLGSMFIADTIIPWAALWLYYYEVWHATGEWHGGGEHPQVRRRKGKGR